jgi:hypothetical protein
MMGRKFEEGDWSYVYCRAKGIPEQHWSNLNIDVMHENLGVEHKMLCRPSHQSLAQAFGTTLMHPALTRSIRIPSAKDPNKAMADILGQYGANVRSRIKKIDEQDPTGKGADLRIGWLLWQESLRQFLYFEEQMVAPDPSAYYAEWVERTGGSGTRKGSKNLWVFEKSSGRKRCSITTAAGAKIQPYFDVPPPDDPNTYLFTVIGEQFALERIRVWLTPATARELERVVGSLGIDAVSDAVLAAAAEARHVDGGIGQTGEAGVSVVLREDAYRALVTAYSGVSDEHSFQQFLEQFHG